MNISDYEYNEHGEVTNVRPEVDQPDFRAYPPESKVSMHKGKAYRLSLCADRIGGRWEYFISMKEVK